MIDEKMLKNFRCPGDISDDPISLAETSTFFTGECSPFEAFHIYPLYPQAIFLVLYHLFDRFYCQHLKIQISIQLKALLSKRFFPWVPKTICRFPDSVNWFFHPFCTIFTLEFKFFTYLFSFRVTTQWDFRLRFLFFCSTQLWSSSFQKVI